MFPHLVKWDEHYRERGLVVIDVYNGAIDRSKEAVEQHIQRKGGANFAVAYDAAGVTTQLYGIRAFPTAYLIGVDGKVIWQGFALPEIEKVEKLIETELARVTK